jgi:copper chaperone
MVQLQAKVTGLTCQHCVATVTSELENLEGIANVSVELVNGGESSVMLETAEPDDAVAPIATALARHGYELQSLSTSD